jgi:phosphoenolpyruvate carboxykinase (GTP)
MGSGAGSETTAAALHQAGVLRRDPMAMKPFCGYNFADYWQHWLSFEEKSEKLPKVFHVNWFRQNDQGEYLWPGFGQNIRVLEWIIDRVKGIGKGIETPIGILPPAEALNQQGLNITQANLETLCTVDRAGWKKEIEGVQDYLQSFESRIPKKLSRECEQILNKL